MNNQEIEINLNFLKNKFLLVYLLILLAIPLSMWVVKNKLGAVLGTKTIPANQTIQSDQALLSEIGKIINLPEEENPIIGTVDDLSKLPNQPFFAEAKPGDKILIYKKTEMVYLYNPEQKKIINIGKIDNLSPSPTPLSNTSTPQASQSAKPINLIEKAASSSTDQ